jgi:nitrogen regulatory protein PII
VEPIKRVEIVVSSFELENVLALIEQSGATGYTVVREIFGKGHRGIRDGADISDAFRNTMILTACTDDQAKVIIEKVRPILKKYGGMCLVSEALWVKH